MTFFVRKHLHESAAFLAAKKEAKAKHERVAFSELFKTRQLALQTLGLMVMTIVQIAGYFGLMNWLPVIVQKQQGLSVSGSALWMVATICGMCLGMAVFGNILDHLGPRWAFGLFLTASALIVFAITLARSSVVLSSLVPSSVSVPTGCSVVTGQLSASCTRHAFARRPTTSS